MPTSKKTTKKTTDKAANASRQVHEIDATGQAIGRLATKIATLLRGKHKPEFERHLDLGDIVKVENIGLAKFSGKKFDQKVYHRHSGYPGGLKTEKLSKLFSEKPDEVLIKAVYNMLPKNKLRAKMMKRLKITK